MSNNTNKSQRKLGNKFDATNLNQIFDKKEDEMEKERNKNKQIEKENDDINLHILPHQRSMEEIILSVRELFFKVLEILIDKENPIPYIFSSESRQFAFAIFLLVIGFMLLLFSSVMKSST